MSKTLRHTAPLGELVAAAFDTAAELTSDPKDVSRLATSAVIQVLRRARRLSPMPDDETARPTRTTAETRSVPARMEGGLAHDLKNLLNPIGLYLQLAERASARGDSSRVAEYLALARKLLARGVHTIDRLRDLDSAAARSSEERLELNALVHEVCNIARPMASGVDQVREELGAPLAIMGSPGDLVNALVNLTVNALDAISDRGSVTLRTGQSHDRAWIEVVDDGPGMTPDVVRRAFEPYFTTKGARGTGLGLPMVYACVQQHHGSVKVDTSPGMGACFTLSFPSVTMAFVDP